MLLVGVVGCALMPDAAAVNASVTSAQSGICTASVYWEGRRLADGALFRPDEPLIAHRTLPLGSQVRVTALATGRSVVLTVRDRGPFVPHRCADLSRGAARLLGVSGLPKIILEPLTKGNSP